MNKHLLWLALATSLFLSSPNTSVAQNLTPAQKQLFEALTPEQREELSKLTSKQLLELSNDNSTEKSLEKQWVSFCGVDVSELTDSQKELYNKLTPEERWKLSRIASINKVEWRIKIWSKAIKDTDFEINWKNRLWEQEIDDALEKLWEEWYLPSDVFSWELIPFLSEIDEMIGLIPWANNDEKVKNFRLLTGMDWRYWTSWPGWYHKATWYKRAVAQKRQSGLVFRNLTEDDWSKDSVNPFYDAYRTAKVRFIKSLP